MQKTPYEKYKKNKIWNIVKKAVKKLEENQDINIETLDEYVIGYIVKSLLESKSITVVDKEVASQDNTKRLG